MLRKDNDSIWQNEQGDIISDLGNGKSVTVYKKGQSEVDLFVINKCNSNCVMCPLTEFSRRKRIKEHFSWLMKYLELLPSDIPYMNITGGEPTLAGSEFIEVLKILRSKFQHTEFQLLTNGRSFSDKAFLNTVMMYMPNQTRFAIPLHSYNPEIHDYITRAPGSFKQTDQGIRNLLALSQKVEIRLVLSQLNLGSILQTAKYIIKEYPGVLVVNFIGMEMMGNAAKNKDVLWEEYPAVFARIKQSTLYLIEKGIDVQLYNFPLCAVDRGFWPITARSITDYKIRYKEECTACVVKDVCGGFFSSTLKMMNPQVKVIKDI